MTQPHHRRSIRLPGYDYSAAGVYFITICAQGRECLFGEIMNGQMQLSEIGAIAQQQWDQIPARFVNVELGPFVIMPNHIHIILIITATIVRAGFTPPQGNRKG